jgi:radical SAM superfamily enzyme YgiQ (UPF0313 family)
MSGVRIKNERLLSLGMTLPGFVERGKVIASLPSLGLLTIAGCFPENWELDYLEIDDLDDSELSRRAQDADLVAISTLAARTNDAYRIADQLRAEGKVVVFGGLHASALPNEVLLHANAVVVGEGEPAWSKVLEDYENGQLRQIYRSADARDPVHEFGCHPFPRWDLLEPEKYNRLTLQTTRGCPLDCEFCAASRLISPYRRKSLDRVDAELDRIKEFWPHPFIELADDNTFVNKKWARELVRVLAKHDLRWFTESDISVADDPELLEGLAESGCAQLLIGLESVDATSLESADTKGWKKRKRDSYLERIERIQSYGISVNGCFVIGFDSDGLSVFEATRDFVLESRLSEVQITILTPFPGTALYRRLLGQGRLKEESFWDECTLFDLTFSPTLMSREELESGFHWLAGELYSPEATNRRKSIFRSCVRQAKERNIGRKNTVTAA